VAWALGDPNRSPLHPYLHDLNWGTAVAMSLPTGYGQGGIQVVYPPGSDPDLTDLLQLSTIGSQIVLLVENIRLFEEAQGKAALEERQRLARDLHDSVSQALYGISLGAHSAKQALGLALTTHNIKSFEQSLDYLIHMAETAMAEMKSLIFELRPESLEREGLIVALRKHLRALELRHRFKLSLTLGAEPSVALGIKEMLYRVVQEAMNNIVKHAQATQVWISLMESNGGLELEVRDNGIGFDPQEEFPGHLGLHSMAERVKAVGGIFTLKSSSQGTQVHVRIAPGLVMKENL
jgi:signal transduction histidine kinase